MMDKRELAELLMKLAAAVVLPVALFVVFKAWQLVFGGLDRRHQARLMRHHHQRLERMRANVPPNLRTLGMSRVSLTRVKDITPGSRRTFLAWEPARRQ
jgi:hypothetical protein